MLISAGSLACKEAGEVARKEILVSVRALIELEFLEWSALVPMVSVKMLCLALCMHYSYCNSN